MQVASREQAGPWQREWNDAVRGLSGGFLFGIPLLYTMEVWWLGVHSEAWRILVLLAVSFGINWMLEHFTGFREGAPPAHAVTDALESLALGMLAAAATLLVLGEIHGALPYDVIIGKIAVEAVPFSLGVSIANGFLRGRQNQSGEGADNGGSAPGDQAQNGDADQSGKQRNIHGTLLDAGATIGGALFVSLSVAPTEEIPMLAGNIGPWQIIVLILFSLLVSYGITFEAGFANQEARMQQQGIFQRPVSETVFSYLVALLVSALLLWLFKQLEFADPWHVWLDRSVVLALPAAIGGSAGRLAVGG